MQFLYANHNQIVCDDISKVIDEVTNANKLGKKLEPQRAIVACAITSIAGVGVKVFHLFWLEGMVMVEDSPDPSLFQERDMRC